MKSIYEIMTGMTQTGMDYGQGHNIGRQRSSQTTYSWEDTGPKTDPAGNIYSFCHQLRNDQQDIVRALQSGKDVLVNMGAGGGKTLPVVCYWLNNILHLNVFLKRNLSSNERYQMNSVLLDLFFNTKSLPKIMFLVPTKTLANQTEQEFRDIFSEILMQYFLKATNLNNLHKIENPNNFKEVLDNLKMIGNAEIRSSVQRYENNVFNIYVRQMMNNKLPIETLNGIHHRKLSTFDIEFLRNTEQFFSILEQLTKEYIFKISGKLCVKKTGEDSGSGIENSLVAVAIYQSAPSVLKRIGKNIKLIICDEAHKIQSSSEHFTDNEAKDISRSFYVLLKNLQNVKTQIVMLTGTIHPQAAENLAEYLKKCVNRKFIIKTLPSKNPSTISVVPSDNLLFYDKQVKLIVDLISNKDFGNLFILYSGKKIETLSEDVLKFTSGTYKSTKDKPIFKGPRLNRRKPVIKTDFLKQPVSSRDAAQIKNPLLRQCVEHGFGFVHSSRNTSFGPVTNEDKNLIQKLFMQKKLSVIIATDAVGVGLNISAKNMYIPINEKFSGHTQQMEDVPIRDLTQIINRVGRGAFHLGYIYTPKKYVSAIVAAISSTPDSFVEVKAIKNFLICNSILFTKLYQHISPFIKPPEID